MSWKKVTFTSGDIAANRHNLLHERFAAVWSAAGAPPAAIMYGPLQSRDRNNYYFTPRAAEVAAALLQSYGAVDCSEPDTRSLAVLVKNSGAGASD